ncbi:hypothetical protein [Streptomyces fungicidicus]|uniref:hypothetical protein n=1 Tax=Streptomyces fungicidicus TaxID=68203 RepID=UPI0033D9401D
MKKFALALFSAVLLSSGLGSSAFANEYPVEESIDLPPEIVEEGIDLLGVYELSPEEEGLLGGTGSTCGDTGGVEVMVTPICTDANLAARDIKYTKENVKFSNSYSNFQRVSDNITGPGSITSTKAVTFGVVVTGAYKNLGLNLNTTKTSTKGYSLTHSKNNTVYMGYRVYYSVETGTRVATMLGRVISRLPYTVKKPITGEYKLINFYP